MEVPKTAVKSRRILEDSENDRRQIQQDFQSINWKVDLDKVAQQDVKEISRVLLGVIAIKYKVYLQLMDEVVEGVTSLIEDFKEMNVPKVQVKAIEQDSRGDTSPRDSPFVKQPGSRVFMLSSSHHNLAEDSVLFRLPMEGENPTDDGQLEVFVLEEQQELVPSSEEFMVAMTSISTLAALKMENAFLNLYNCIKCTNALSVCLRQNHTAGLKYIVHFFSTPYINEGTYSSGRVRLKEAHTYIIESSFGPVQIGIPPETIKTSLKKGENVAKYYVLTPDLFTADVNMGEIEFPIYFNFFMKKAFLNPENKIVIIGEPKHLERVQTVFRESFYGPEPKFMYINEEISPSRKTVGYAIDHKAESFTIASKNAKGEITPITDFATFLPLDAEGLVSFKATIEKDGVTEEYNAKVESRKGLLRLFENGKLVGSVDTNLSLHHHRCKLKRNSTLTTTSESDSSPSKLFVPPTFGVTFLGTSHGFDEKGNTTGFIIWVNGSGILVDPPTNTTSYLRANGIKTTSVNKVILTHCHSDHDAGLLRKIIDGEKIEVYTSKTINESYKRKMNAITGLNIGEYYNFTAVPIGEPINILGAMFEFDYAFHTIPTVRFKLTYGGKSIAYSSDTHYNPEFYANLREKKIINSEREMMLRMFLFDADLIIHESGVPPIHTTVQVLNDLPPSIKQKMRIVHCHFIPSTVEKILPDGKKITVQVKDLKIPPCGLENTIYMDVGQFMEGYSHATRKFSMLTNTFLFQKLSPSFLYQLLLHFEEQFVKQGETIIEYEEYADRFYIIERGTVDIYRGSERTADALLNTRTTGDVFGENALRKAKHIPRSASVVARTDCYLLSIPGSVFQTILSKEDQPELALDYDIARMARMRPFVKEVLSKTYLFQDLTPEQIDCIAAMLEKETLFRKEQYIIHEGDTDNSLFLIETGSVRLVRMDEQGQPRELMTMGVGEVFGELSLITGLPRTCSVLANEDSIILELKKDSFDKMMKQYQNLRVKLALLVEQRLRQSKQIKIELDTPRGVARMPKLGSGSFDREAQQN